MRRPGLYLLTFGLLSFILCCVSQTLHEQRFRESAQLAPPSMTLGAFDSTNFSFGVASDLHIGNQNTERLNRMLQSAAARGEAFMVFPGDMADTGKLEDYNALLSSLNANGFAQKYLPVIGNHDIFDSGWDNYKSLFGASHYVYTNGQAKFIVLDTADGALGETQFQWLEQQLAANQSPLLFLVSHYMPVVPGIRTYLKLANENEAQRLMKLAQRYGVKAWFGGHYHSYVARNIEGTDYIVTGGGGGRRMARSQDGPEAGFFYVHVTVQGSSLNYSEVAVD